MGLSALMQKISRIQITEFMKKTKGSSLANFSQFQGKRIFNKFSQDSCTFTFPNNCTAPIFRKNYRAVSEKKLSMIDTTKEINAQFCKTFHEGNNRIIALNNF